MENLCMTRKVLGLDIGITSVGYGIIDIDENSFVDYGVRLFKEGTAKNNLTRREKRGGRRLKSRRKTRLADMSKLLKEIGIKELDYQPINDPYSVRVKGLTQPLTNHELAAAILHITKHRGSSLETVDDAVTEDSLKSKDVLGKNAKLLKNDKFICQVQLDYLEKEKSIRGLNNNFKTEDYIHELTTILSNQNIDEENKEKILKLVQRKRAYYEGPGSEKSPTPYGRFIEIDGQIQEIDLIEKMRGKCSIFPDQLRAPKMSYCAELFNFLNDINNLEVEGEKITIEQKEKLLNIIDNKGGITPKQLATQLSCDLENISGFRIDKNKKPLLTEFKGFKLIKKCFEKANCLTLLNDKSIIDTIVEILTRTKGVVERKTLIKEKYPIFSEELLNNLKNVTGISGYHAISFKAMHILNEELFNTSMNQMQLLHQLNLFDTQRVSTKGQINIVSDEEAILSPVAKRAQRETCKVINKLRKQYGEFDSIVIETTRDKNSEDRKKRINENQKYHENQNKEVDTLLQEKGYDITKINNKTKMKIKLYMIQDGKSAYTLQSLDLSRVINEPNYCEIDHIIPISVSLDDSFNNKVLTTYFENQQKGNLTPIAAYLKGKFDGVCDINTYKTVIQNNKKLNRKKKEYLLLEKDITRFDVIKEFINRNLVDTSYANRVVLNTLQNYFKDNEISTKVHTVKGQATSAFRKRINLPKDRDEDYLHHAIDALIVASIKKQPLYSDYLAKYDFEKLYDEQTGEIIPVGEDNRLLDPKYIDFISNLKNIYDESSKYYNGLLSTDSLHYRSIKISHKVDTKPNRQVADETIYSTRNIQGIDKVVEKYKNIYDPKLTALAEDVINDKYQDKYLMYRNNPETFGIIRDIIMHHFMQFRDDAKYYVTNKKGEFSLKGENPLTAFQQEFGTIKKYSKKGNGPEVTMMKYLSGALGSHIDISDNYNSDNKKVILKQISPYRTDFYVSKLGKYKFVTIRYKDVFYKHSNDKYCIDSKWYQQQKEMKEIGEDWQFVCSMHHDELIGLVKKEGDKYIYDMSTEGDGTTRYHDGVHSEILKFTATNNDKKNIFEVKPIHTYCKKQLMLTIGTMIKVEKYAVDVLGNRYKVKNNILKLEF